MKKWKKNTKAFSGQDKQSCKLVSAHWPYHQAPSYSRSTWQPHDSHLGRPDKFEWTDWFCFIVFLFCISHENHMCHTRTANIKSIFKCFLIFHTFPKSNGRRYTTIYYILYMHAVLLCCYAAMLCRYATMLSPLLFLHFRRFHYFACFREFK